MYRMSTMILFVSLATLPLLSSAAEPTKDSLPTVQENIQTEKAILVDVREQSEWDRGHIAGAVFLPLSKLGGLEASELARRLPKDKIVYTHCVVGKRSLSAATVLEQYGYDARSLNAGYQELLEAGFPQAED